MIHEKRQQAVYLESHILIGSAQCGEDLAERPLADLYAALHALGWKALLECDGSILLTLVINLLCIAQLTLTQDLNAKR